MFTLASIFIPLIVIALTQFVKLVAPKISGALTIVVAVVIGIVCSIFATWLGLEPVPIAQGIMYGLAAVGIHTASAAVNTAITKTPTA